MPPTDHTTREPTPGAARHRAENADNPATGAGAEQPDAAADGAAADGAAADDAGSGGPEAEVPGSTTIAPKAVERIATQVVADFTRVGGTANRTFGITVNEAGQARDAAVAVRLHGQQALSLAVRCSVPYPFDIRQATDTLRAELVERVGGMTGMSVQRVDITVTALTLERGRRVA